MQTEILRDIHSFPDNEFLLSIFGVAAIMLLKTYHRQDQEFMSNCSPLVSICVPSFNSSQYLGAAFNSLLSQTYSNLELVFVDDASTDDSWKVALSFEPLLKRRLTRVVMIKNEGNLGTLLSMHNAFSYMTGDFASYLDADDCLTPNKIEKNLDFLMRNSQFGAVHSDFSAVDERYNVISDFWKRSEWAKIPQGWIFEEMLSFNPICAATLLVRKSLWDRCYTFDIFAQRKYKMGDYPGHLNLSRLTQVGYIDQVLAYYRHRDNSMSHSSDPRTREDIKAVIARVQQDARLGILRPLRASGNGDSYNFDPEDCGAFPGSGLAGTPTTVQ
ncbi:MAG: glycosyltransferase family 2 protein [Candidatus Melainabacteria bacterium]|nr:glycosyltransferase family 2 protein [Candidatus Melainabacteria bacterium]